MSVVRSAYRHVLRQCAKTAKRIPDVDDLCFCVFGITLRLEDLKAAGYGDTPKAIARTFFDRPSIPDVPRDSAAARLQAAFSVLRELRAVDKLDIETIQMQRKKTIAEIVEKTSTPKGAPEKDTEKEVNGGECEDTLTDEVHMTTVTIYLDVPGKKIRKFERRVVLPNVFEKFPNYAYLMPPEPFYATAMRNEMTYPLLIDSLICISAGSRKRARDLKLAQTPMPSKRSRASRKALAQRQTAGTANFARPMPTSIADLESSVNEIGTRAIVQSEFMEVELRTQYVCYNPYVSHEEDSSSGSASSTDIVAARHLFLYYMSIRNRGPVYNPKLWHVQVASYHFVVLDEETGQLIERATSGVVGNYPFLAPGESHVCVAGTSMKGKRGIMRGSIQVHAYHLEGKEVSRVFDIPIPPTRLSTEAVASPFGAEDQHDRAKEAKRELVERKREHGDNLHVGDDWMNKK